MIEFLVGLPSWNSSAKTELVPGPQETSPGVVPSKSSKICEAAARVVALVTT